MPSLYSEGDRRRRTTNPAVPESWAEPGRDDWRRDYARLVHSPSYRRLQGKTQLFPGFESDYFRNRLTHSIEVAQIAVGIASMLNRGEFKKDPINLQLVENAALAHDLGHPPFGHNGERALDDRMKDHGGFEGNAQTLRILARLEEKAVAIPSGEFGPEEQELLMQTGIDPSGRDFRLGLDWTFRSLAGVLKYDEVIPRGRPAGCGLIKGYYKSEQELVRKIKENVVGNAEYSNFRTIECSIMDVADDITYSTYDLEDCMQAGLLTPLSLVSEIASNNALANTVCDKIRDDISKQNRQGVPWEEPQIDPVRLIGLLADTINDFIETRAERHIGEEDGRTIMNYRMFAYDVSMSSDRIGSNPYRRVEFTSSLIKRFLSGIRVAYNATFPSMSKVFLAPDVFLLVAALKHFTYEKMILSQRLKIFEYRGYEIIRSIFDCLISKGGETLLPEQWQERWRLLTDDYHRRRLVCDFISGMTDRFAFEFYARLFGENPRSVFRPPEV
jgi:dGTPase